MKNNLTKREAEILDYFKKGLTYQRTASELSISPETVRKHANHIYTKLDVKNCREAINKVYGN